MELDQVSYGDLTTTVDFSPEKSKQFKHRKGRSLSKLNENSSPIQKQAVIMHVKYKENWYQEQRVVYPKKSLLEKVQQKQEIFKFRKNLQDPQRHQSSIHGFQRKVNSDKYFGTIGNQQAKLMKGYYVRGNLKEGNEDESEIKNEISFENVEEGAQTDRPRNHLQLPSILDGQKRSISLNPTPQKARTEPNLYNFLEGDQIKKNNLKKNAFCLGTYTDQQVYGKSYEILTIHDFKKSVEDFEEMLSENKKKEKEKQVQIMRQGSKIIDLTESKKTSDENDLNNDLTSSKTLLQVTEVDEKEERNEMQDKFRNLIGNLKEITSKLLAILQNNEEIKQLLENMLSIKLLDISSLLVKFFKYCVEKMITTGSKQKICAIDMKILKSLFITINLVQPLEKFFLNQLEKVDFKKEKDNFKKIWRRECLKFILVDNLLLEMGGLRRLESVLINMQTNIQKHFQIKFTPIQKEHMKIFALGLYQDSSTFIPSIIANFKEKNTDLDKLEITPEDLFILKHFVFLELQKEEYIPWEHKTVILSKIESLRFDYFREIYNLVDSKEVVAQIKQLMPTTLMAEFPYLNQEEFNNFYELLEKSILGKGSPDQLISAMIKDKIDPKLNTILMLEQLMKQSLKASKNSPQILKKVIEHKFTIAKRILQILTSFKLIEQRLNEIISKMSIMIAVLLKYFKTSDLDYAIYSDISFFTQVLTQCCSSLDALSLDDIIYGRQFYNIQKKHYLFWVKSLKRVLLEMKFTVVEVLNLTQYLVKLFEDSFE